jgi:F-type H+-transporting ATPase subunit gamma
MESIETLKKRIATTEGLQSVVKTMKALAAINIRHYEQAVESLAEYHRTITKGLQIVLKIRPEETLLTKPAPTRRIIGAIVFGSDQGLCGMMNEQIALHARLGMKAMNGSPEDRAILAIGMRVTGHLEDAGLHVEESLPMPSSRAGITLMAQDILIKIEEWQTQAELDHIVLFYQTFIPDIGVSPHTFQMLPIDPDWLHQLEHAPWPSPVFPIATMKWDQLFSRLIRQYLFVSLSRALAQSLASENVSRMASMQRAERNISQHVETLQGQFSQQRQTSITEELLDIIGGFEALTTLRRT